MSFGTYSGAAGALADELGAIRQRQQTQHDEAKKALRDRQADDLEKAISNIQANTTLSPEQKTKDIDAARQQLQKLYQPHEAPHLMERLKRIFGGGQKQSTSGQIDLHPGMTLSEVLAIGSPAPAAPKVVTQPWAGPDGKYYVTMQDEQGNFTQKLVPGMVATNEWTQKLQDVESAYRATFGKDMTDEEKEKFFSHLVGGAPLDQKPVKPEEKLEADKGSKTGWSWVARDDTGKEVFRRQGAPPPPRADSGAGGSDEAAVYGQQVASGSLLLTQVPTKIRGKVLTWMSSNKIALPAQLTQTVRDKLTQREAALDSVITIMEDIKPDLDVLETLPDATLLNLSQSPGVISRIASWFTPAEEKEKIERLAGNMRSLHEGINILRLPLGSTGFRGGQGWNALQEQAIMALTTPGVTEQTFDNTLRTMKKLQAATEKVLGNEDETSAGDTGNADLKPPRAPAAGMKWQHRTVKGKVEWREVPIAAATK